MNKIIKDTGLKDLLIAFKEEGIDPQLNLKKLREEYAVAKDNKAPVLVQVLMFIGSLIAAGFFLGFLGLCQFFESEILILILGVIITAGAIAIPYISKQNSSTEPLSLAALIVGSILIVIGYLSLGNFSTTVSLIISLLLSLVILFISASHLQKITAVYASNLSLFCLILDAEFMIGFNFLVLINASVVTFLLLKEPQVLSSQSRLGQWYDAILNGCSVSLIAVLIFSVNNRMYFDPQSMNTSFWWISSLLLIALVLWTLYETLELLGIKKQKIPLLVGVGIALMILIQAPGIISGILLLFLGLFSGYRIFSGQGILAIFFFTLMFYYNLNTTLLFKSMLMVGAGILFLALGYGIKRGSENQNI